LTGYVFILVGFVISWMASLKFLVALSTTEVEYMALTKVANEGISVKKLVMLGYIRRKLYYSVIVRVLNVCQRIKSFMSVGFHFSITLSVMKRGL